MLDRKPEYREVTLPAGTVLPLELTTAVASDTSKVEDPVRATLRRSVSVDGVQVLPAGTAVLGHVTSAERSAKVKGRASVAFRFNQIDLPGDGGRERDQHRDGLPPRARRPRRRTRPRSASAPAPARSSAASSAAATARPRARPSAAAPAPRPCWRRAARKSASAAGTPVSVKLTAPLTVRSRRSRHGVRRQKSGDRASTAVTRPDRSASCLLTPVS